MQRFQHNPNVSRWIKVLVEFKRTQFNLKILKCNFFLFDIVMSLDATHYDHMNELIIILAINIKMVLPLFSQNASTHPSQTHEILQ